jgi:hypothetical protein
MKVSKAPFKKVVDIIKRLGDAKDRENGQMVIQCHDGETILCYGRASTMFTFHTLKNLDESTFSFVVNPFDLLEMLGGKDKVKMYSIGDVLTDEATGKTLPVTPYEKEIRLPFSDFTPFRQPKEFRELLQNTEKMLSTKGEKIASAYLKFGAKAAFTADPICLQHFRMDEAFPFETGYLHVDQISVLTKAFVKESKSVRSDLLFSLYNGTLVIKNDVEPRGKGKENDDQANYYMLKINHEIPFPTFDPPHEEEEKRVSFKVDADKLNELLGFYTVDCKDFYLYEQGGMLVLDPYGKKESDDGFDEGEEKHPLTWIRFTPTRGEFGRYKINAVALKNLFLGYSGEVEVYQVTEARSEDEFVLIWRIYSPYRISSIIGKTEPNYERVDRIISELEKKQKEELEKRKRSAS